MLNTNDKYLIGRWFPGQGRYGHEFRDTYQSIESAQPAFDAPMAPYQTQVFLYEIIWDGDKVSKFQKIQSRKR